MMRTRVVVWGAVLVGLGGLTACGTGGGGTPVAVGSSAPVVASPSPVESATPSPSVTASSGTPKPPPAEPGVLSGERQVWLVPLEDGKETPESVVSVAKSGRAEVSGDFGDRALFVPVPVSKGSSQFSIKTGKLVKGGEPYCLEVTPNGSEPLTLTAQACDTRDKNQQFTFQKQQSDYLIQSDGVYLRWDPDGNFGLIAEESGEGTDLTRWRLRDQGAATLPALD